MSDYIMQSYMRNERETERKDEPMPLLKMTSDFVFKAVLGQDTPRSQAALKALLTLLLQREGDPIESVKCENPLIAADYKGGKASILDLKVRLSSGLIIDLEMQVNHLKNYINRTLFYMGKLII
ncbi:MAG: PD-(D/E)XK nuclease family transposase, partial [Firmicutes bacterium]|nr:PD-(D/E)XK nuclease family transposase [Bacillota bacterium]